MSTHKIQKQLETGLKTIQERMVLSRCEGADSPVLTIDATYNDGRTEQLLDVLEEYGSHATFFLSGIWTEKYAGKHIERMEKLGCEIGNHSYDHPFFHELTQEEKIFQITKTQELNESVSAHAKKYFRFPFGTYQTRDLILAEKLGYRIIQWSVESFDWKYHETEQVLKCMEQTGPGDILIIHNDGEKTADALRLFLKERKEKEQDFGFITLTEALERR